MGAVRNKMNVPTAIIGSIVSTNAKIVSPLQPLKFSSFMYRPSILGEALFTACSIAAGHIDSDLIVMKVRIIPIKMLSIHIIAQPVYGKPKYLFPKL